jgi:multiple sugar transport system substrate-binding protein
MRKALVAAAAVLFAGASGCTSGDHQPSRASGSGSGSAAHTPVTVEFWVGWTDRDFDNLRTVLDSYETSHPWVTVHAVPGQSDPTKITQAVTAGQGPDLATAWGTADLGKLCTSGVLTDLSRYAAHDHVTNDQFPAAARAAFDYRGKHCALPYLADTFGLYYNKDLLAKAGYNHPPRTSDELVDMAVRLTTYNRDGSIKVAGFMPLTGVLENWVTRYAGWFGASWFDENGKANLSRDPKWTQIFEFHKKLIDRIGYAKLKHFSAVMGDEWTAANPFENGKVAMEIDGEWRTQMIATQHPNLHYAVAPFPAPAGDTALAGASEIGVTLLAVPKGAKHIQAAWDLARYLAVETEPLLRFANAIHNVPTTNAGLTSSKLDLGPNGGPFVSALTNPHSSFPTILDAGPVYFDVITDFIQRWQAGKIKDLASGLAKLDRTIDQLVAQG